MGQDTDDIKVRIAHTKDAIVDTVVQTQERVADAAQGSQEKIGEALDAAGSRVKSFQDVARQKLLLPGSAGQSNPLLLLLGVAAAAFAAGYIIPLSALEKLRLSPLGEDLARRAEAARDEVVSQGSAVVSETIAAAKTSLKTHGEETAAYLGVSENPSAKGPAERTRATAAEH